MSSMAAHAGRSILCICTAFALVACGQTPEPIPRAQADLKLWSPAFEDGARIPLRYAHGGVDGGENVSIPYIWAGAPDSTRSLALVIVDAHPGAGDWVHWMVVDIPVTATAVPEGASGAAMPTGARELRTTFGEIGYGGPEPPKGGGDHEYVATLYALDVDTLDVADTADANDLLQAMQGHVLALAEYSGVFGR